MVALLQHYFGSEAIYCTAVNAQISQVLYICYRSIAFWCSTGLTLRPCSLEHLNFS